MRYSKMTSTARLTFIQEICETDAAHAADALEYIQRFMNDEMTTSEIEELIYRKKEARRKTSGFYLIVDSLQYNAVMFCFYVPGHVST